MKTNAPSVECSRAPRFPIAILGVLFDAVSLPETLDLIDRMISSREPHYVATANVDFVVQALEDEELRRILFDAHLVVCDGTPLLWASRLLGNALPERVAGSDLTPRLLERAAAKGHRVYLLGAKPEVLERAVQKLRESHPNLRLAGWESPAFAPLHEMDHEGICQRIRDSRADILLVSFGCPKQEKWIAMHYVNAGAPVNIGVGATIDFLAGEVQRAPRWMRESGLEWLFRLLQEPRRLYKRYAKDLIVFAWGFARQWRCLRSSSNGAGAVLDSAAPATSPGWKPSTITLPSRLDAAAVQTESTGWEAEANAPGLLYVDASRVEFVDSTGIGALIRLNRIVKSNAGTLQLYAPSATLQRALDLMKMSGLFSVTQVPPGAIQPVAGEAPLASVRSIRRAGQQQIVWSGEVTSVTTDLVWARTALLLDSGTQPGDVVTINLEQVRFLDSSGIALMIRLTKAARMHQLTLRFINAGDPVERVIRLAKLESILLGKAA